MQRKKQKKFTRFTALIVVILIVFSAIGFQLVNLQVINADTYKAKASTNHKFIKEDAPRGQISDSTGTVLAGNVKSYDITYMETDATKKVFYSTMAKVFYILDQNGEAQLDNFPIKVDSTYSFDFKTNDPNTIKAQKLRFLKDRGFQDNIIKNLYGSKKESELTKAQKSKVDEYLLKLTAEYVFNKLAGKKGYDIPKSYSFEIDGKTVTKQCTVQDIRRFMVVKDAVKMQSYSGYKPVDVASNIKETTAFAFYQKLDELPGIDVSTVPIRNYPYGMLASNVLGYIGKITTANDSETNSYEEKGYDVSSDLVGISGLESSLEDRLKGTAGGKVVDVDRNGRIINEIANRDPYPGQNVKLTLNKDVQYAAEQALASVTENLRKNPNGFNNSYTGNATRGAAVAIDVNTGGVIALASYPNFNPNDFANPNGLSDAAINKYFPTDLVAEAKQYNVPDSLIDTLFPVVDKSTGQREDKYDYLPKPLFNYATMGLTPPGSTFKPLTAIAGLESGAIYPGFSVYDPGSFDDGKGFHTDFKADGNLGTNDLVNAIAKSSNGYFMTVGKLIRDAFGEDKIAEYAWKFGLGVKPNSGVNASTGIEIKENFGQVFNSYSIKSNFGQQAAWQVMADLKNKKYSNGYQAIDLYTHDSDNTQLANLKASIKAEIRQEVVNEKFNKSKFTELINKLIETDTQYGGKALSSSQINSICNGVKAVVNDYIYQATIPANTYNASIGQGVNEFTPVQLANYVATIANGGKRYKVHLVDQITDAEDGAVVYKYTPQVVDNTGVSQSTLNTIKEGMKKVNTIGTAAGKFDNFPFTTAGKTGTADPFSTDLEKSIGRTSYALYVGFAPADNPKIAVATIVYDGGFGGTVTDIAKAIYEAYFNKVDKVANMPQDFPITAQSEVDNK